MLRCLTAGAAATMMSKSAFVLFSFVSVRVAFGAPTTRNVTCVWIKVLIALLPALFLARRNVNQRNIHTVACDSWKRERESGKNVVDSRKTTMKRCLHVWDIFLSDYDATIRMMADTEFHWFMTCRGKIRAELVRNGLNECWRSNGSILSLYFIEKLCRGAFLEILHKFKCNF